VPGGYPIILDISTRQIIVVGGGAVAVRKVKGLLAGGATRLRVISPAFDPQMPQGIERIEAPYRPGCLAGAALVFAATDSAEVNAAVVAEARAIGAFSSRADEQEESSADFTTPAVLRDGPVLVTVSTGGNPALSSMIRDRLASAIDPDHVRLAEAMQTLRPLIRVKLPPPRRREAFRMLCSDAAVAALSQAGSAGLRAWLVEMFPEIND
jgi:precorrin-2 dehydrogenase/sirohydrochlorin ferrochelatase